MKKQKINQTDLNILLGAGLSQLESVAVINLLNQKNKSLNKDYVFKIKNQREGD